MWIWLTLSALAGFYDGDTAAAPLGQSFRSNGLLLGAQLGDDRDFVMSGVTRRGWMVAPATRAFLRYGGTADFGADRTLAGHLGGGLALDITAAELIVFGELGGALGRGLPDGLHPLAQTGAALTLRRRLRNEGMEDTVRFTTTLEGRHTWVNGESYWTALGAVGIYLQTQGEAQ